MALAISITSVIQGAQGMIVNFNVVPSGSYVAGGDVLDFTKATQDAAFQGIFTPIESSIAPLQLDIWPQGGSSASTMLANQLIAVLGTTLANCKMIVSAAATFGTEFTAGAYSAGLLAMKITGSLVVARLI